MTSLRTAMHEALAAASTSAKAPSSASITTPAQVWVTLTSAQKDKAVVLFQQQLSNCPDLIMGVDSCEDTLPEDSNRVEAFYFGPADVNVSLAQVQVLKTPLRVSRQVSFDDCVFQTRRYSVAALLTHSQPIQNPVTKTVSYYTCQQWLTVEGLACLVQCLLDSTRE